MKQPANSYTIDDPRPAAVKNPYTFFSPLPNLLEQLRIGDLVKLIFIADPPSDQWAAERMWVKINAIDPDGSMEGSLVNTPRDLPALKPGDIVCFSPHHIIDFKFDEDNQDPPISYDTERFPPPREYWERCIVDNAVLNGELKIEHIERQVPSEAGDDKTIIDSGWQIWADTRGLTYEQIAERPYSYVALGVVLNMDDSWIAYIDCPIGASFTRNWETGLFEEDTDDE
jgi:hypothetical protein